MGRLHWALTAALAGALGCSGSDRSLSESSPPDRDRGGDRGGRGTQSDADDEDADGDHGHADDEHDRDHTEDGDGERGDDAPTRGTRGRDAGMRDAGARDAGRGTPDAGRPAPSVPGPKPVANMPPERCGEAKFDVTPVVPDMLIVLDRSASMAGVPLPGQLPGSQVDRWGPSVAAIKSLTTRFRGELAFGLMTFPAEGQHCAPGDVRVPVAPGSEARIAQTLDMTVPGGGTPTGETLQRALAAYRATPPRDATPRYVLLVTDGQPTCPSAGGNTLLPEALTSDRLLALQAIDALASAGVKTFVIGYDAALDPQLASALSQFAERGGTQRYYPVQDESSLTRAFADISTIVTSCSFEFKQPVQDPDYLGVELDGVLLRRNDPNGWSIAGQTITIQGSSCARLQDGKPHKVEIRLECFKPQ